MKYTFELEEFDASETIAPRQDEESMEEFHARVDAARGKSVVMLTMLDTAPDQIKPGVSDDTGKLPVQRMFSPYYLSDNENARWAILAQTLKVAKKAIVERERGKPAPLRIVV